MNSECNLNLKSFQSNSPRSGLPQLSGRMQGENVLQNALLLTEMGMELKEQTMSGQKYVSCLRSMTLRAAKIMSVLQSSSRSFLSHAQKLVQSGLESMPSHDLTLKSDYEKILNIIERELGEIDEVDYVNSPASPGYTVAERLKYLEEKQKLSSDNLLPLSNSARSVKSDVDEKYPENLSRESLIDLNSVVNLPTVPEDMFTGFANKPTRTSSLSSLKSMRKVKLFLQRASISASDEDDESSDEHDYNKTTAGDYEEGKGVTCISPKKIHLGNITEEALQD